MKIAYSTDQAYLSFYQSAAAGHYDTNFVADRLRVCSFAAGTSLFGVVRTGGRIINLIIEIAKVIFYSAASLVTLGKFYNFERLKDHSALLALNIAALVAQPLQIAIHMTAIGVGLINPKIAYHMMQVGAAPLSLITGYENQIWNNYRTPEICDQISDAIKTKASVAFQNAPWVVEMIALTIINEFSDAFASALVAPLGFMEPFRIFKANPEFLTDEQKELIPILLLNGNYSHQGTFLPLLHALDQAGNTRAVYTINLPPNSLTNAPIVEKVNDIKKQYGKQDDNSFKIDMIGHSMGSGCIQYLDSKQINFKVHRGITVGSPFYYKDVCEKHFDITAKKDLLIRSKSTLEESFQKDIDTGHLGLLFNQESLLAMQEFLEA